MWIKRLILNYIVIKYQCLGFRFNLKDNKVCSVILSKVLSLYLSGTKLKHTACHLIMALTYEIHLVITFAECIVV